jgi:hypothetical protein
MFYKSYFYQKQSKIKFIIVIVHGEHKKTVLLYFDFRNLYTRPAKIAPTIGIRINSHN